MILTKNRVEKSLLNIKAYCIATIRTVGVGIGINTYEAENKK